MMIENLPFRIDSWALEMFNSTLLLNDVKLMEKRYLLNKNKSKYTLLESCVLKISQTILEKENIIYDEKIHNIEFCKYENSTLENEYNKDKKCPIISSLLILSDSKNQLLFTNINNDEYKYKELPDENDILIAFTEKNKIISFDSSKFFGFYNFDYKEESNPICLLINIWNTEITNYNLYDLVDIEKSNSTSSQISEITELVSPCIEPKLITNNFLRKKTMNISIIEKILYDYEDNLNEINEILLTEKELFESKTLYNGVFIKNTINCIFDKDYLINKYGNIITPFFPFINNFNELEETNKFNKSKIIKNILSNDVCYWIINECEIYNNWSKSKYINYPNYLNLELLPSVYNLIKYLLNFWLHQIKLLYDIEKTININIKDIFITKYLKTSYSDIKNKDDTFLSMNILLNNKVDYTRGEIIFKEDEAIIIEQGDMLIFNGKRDRTSGTVTEGEKFVLVILTELKLEL